MRLVDAMQFPRLKYENILHWLQETDEARLDGLWREADAVREQAVGNEVHLRGLIEISNYCVRSCMYCGLRAPNRDLPRYRMTETEIMESVDKAVRYGYGTVVMQGGEDYGISTELMAHIVRRIKRETPLAVTLSLGERGEDELRTWRLAGADRYLLRFETSDAELYARIHPSLPGQHSDRIALLRAIKSLGYETGGGVMAGVPGQTYASLAKDIETFGELDLDMIGVGPYIPHPLTPLGSGNIAISAKPEDQVPNSALMACKAIALARLICPEANIPSTTALATLDRNTGHEMGLRRGANVIMPNLTPPRYRTLYEVYPDKGAIDADSSEGRERLLLRITALGRTVGAGPGGRLCRMTANT